MNIEMKNGVDNTRLLARELIKKIHTLLVFEMRTNSTDIR